MNTSHIIAVLVVLAVGSFALFFPSHLGRQAEQHTLMRVAAELERARQAEETRQEALAAEVAGYQAYLESAKGVQELARKSESKYWPTTVQVLLQQMAAKTPETIATAKDLIELADLLREPEPSQELLKQYAGLQVQFKKQTNQIAEIQSRYDAAYQQFFNYPGAPIAVDFLEFSERELAALEGDEQTLQNWLSEEDFAKVAAGQQTQNRSELEEAVRRFELRSTERKEALQRLQDLAKLVVSGVEGQLPTFRDRLKDYPKFVRAFEHERNVLTTGFAYVTQMHKPGMFFDWNVLKSYRGDKPLIPELNTPSFDAWMGNEQWDFFVLRIEREIKSLSQQRTRLSDSTEVNSAMASLDLATRQTIFKKIANLEQKAATNAIIQFPNDATQQVELEDRLRVRYLDDLASSFGLTRLQLQAISAEGAAAGWDF